jgi:hypothetical protein
MNVQLCRHSTDGAEIALCVRLLNFWPSIVWKVRVMLSAAIIRLPAALPADLTLDMLCTGYLRNGDDDLVNGSVIVQSGG